MTKPVAHPFQRLVAFERRLAALESAVADLLAEQTRQLEAQVAELTAAAAATPRKTAADLDRQIRSAWLP